MISELILTEDGSNTLYVPEIDECYHSSHGAIQESRHIFIEAGLKHCAKKEIRVLEIGFGTGLNAFLTLIEAEGSGKKIHYTSLEKYPVEVEKALKLNYPEELSPESRDVFEKLHTTGWNQDIQINSSFTLNKIEADFTCYTSDNQFDVIYFDAFSPEKQPDLWKTSVFQKLSNQCSPMARIVTYCAKGVVRRSMIESGFVVERIPGPPGKREILRGTKTQKTAIPE